VKNVWSCKGACGEGGDVIDWVMRAEGVSFRHALELAETTIFRPPPARRPPKICTVPKLPPLIDDADDQKLLGAGGRYYHETLKQTPEAQQYLEKRGLQSAEMIEHFRLGFSNRTLATICRQEPRRRRGAQRGRLQELGIYRERSGHEHFNGSLVIPIFDLSGQVVQMYGRKITTNLRAGTDPITCTCRDRIAGCGTKRRSRLERHHPVRSADRRADVLVRGLSQRDHELRGERLYRRAPRGVPEARHEANLYRLRPRRSGRKARPEARRRTDGRWASSVSGCSFRRAWMRTNTRSRCSPPRRV
jgi:hypothetical protein